MILTIIETGLPPETLRAANPDYPAMFARLIGPADPEITFETVSVVKGEALPDPTTLQAILITGSPAGVYDDTPWMQPLTAFIRAADRAGTPMVGICFGHQIMAQALGGHAEKSAKGWGIGRHSYAITHRADWMAGNTAPRFALAVSHQDQVTRMPEGARVIAASDFTPYAAIAYQGGKAISFQGHPEFDNAFSAALYDIRSGTRIPTDAVNAAKASLSQPDNNADVARWIVAFLRSVIR